jgi:hypothetical protein
MEELLDVSIRVLDAPAEVSKVKVDRTDAMRINDRLRQVKCRTAKVQREQVTAYKVESKQVPTKSEACEILAKRGMKNPHLIEVNYELALSAATALDVIPNRYYFQNGLGRTLASTKGHEKLLEIDHDALVSSETLTNGELFGLFDYSVSWREPEVTFQDFIETRKRVKGDWYALGVEFLDKQFEPQPHGDSWRPFLPQFNSDLKAGYSQKEMGEWLARQTSTEVSEKGVRTWLLMCSRNSFKSSVGICFLISSLLCCGSLRLLLVSETIKLSRDFIRLFRSYWEVGSGEPTRFNYWWPEMTIPQGDGSSLSFSCPMRTLRMAQPSAAISSCDTSIAGARYDLGYFDDVVSNTSTGTDEACLKGISVFDSLQKLRELNSNSGMTLVFGTPWAKLDLYDELVRRHDAALPGERTIAVKREPAWVVKPSHRHLPILMLTADMVDLTFPSRLNFKLLMAEARSSLALFRSQHLVEHFDNSDDSIVTFTREAMDKSVRAPMSFPLAKRQFRVLAVDTAFSTSRTADFSAIATLDFLENPNEQTGVLENLAFVQDLVLRRMKSSDLAVEICDQVHKWRPTTPGGELRCVIEKSGDWQSLQENLQRSFLMRGRVLPSFYFKPVANIQGGASVLAKTNRIKGYVEPLLNEGKLLFSSNIAQWEEVCHQFISFDGVRRSGSTRKDDAPDVISIALSTFYPRTQAAEAKPDEALLEYENQTRIQQHLAMQHERVFGGTSFAPLPYQPDNLEPAARHALLDTLGHFNMTRGVRRAA